MDRSMCCIFRNIDTDTPLIDLRNRNDSMGYKGNRKKERNFPNGTPNYVTHEAISNTCASGFDRTESKMDNQGSCALTKKKLIKQVPIRVVIILRD
ncbi:hypothetical protein C922_04845 [Plasmodium inui San Antonio 1]|uniref:Uncharacterized protein n=1 Tax=Plasmodium inui San Antonio 1 TaxID=1237626 RepID=W6ZZT5_9APIC|nr:hypothetical protein C922_04845 [Plasmodium inui San Antonio 1]EUD64805.1 hypothetical protein C922_04845 [Plasmodium inui San Antonio 1]